MLPWACYGPTPGTGRRHDLYRIAVDRGLRGRGVGRLAQARLMVPIGEAGGERIRADTSGRDIDAATRHCYRAPGYGKLAELANSCLGGDDGVVDVKELV